MAEALHAFPKSEKLCGKTTIARVMKQGHWFSTSLFRVCFLKEESGPSRILTSVPKRYFKRAVKRNLLKRRIREAYRLNKEELPQLGYLVMLVYTGTEVSDYQSIEAEVKAVLRKLALK